MTAAEATLRGGPASALLGERELQGPEFLDHRLAVYGEEQRMVLGANTFRQFVQLLGPSTTKSEVSDPVNTRMRHLPTTVVSFTTDIPSLSAWGKPFLLGPGSITVAHTEDEFVSKRDLEQAVELYSHIGFEVHVTGRAGGRQRCFPHAHV